MISLEVFVDLETQSRLDELLRRGQRVVPERQECVFPAKDGQALQEI